MADNRKQIGTDYLLFVNIGTDLAPNWKVPLCQTSLTLNFPLATIDASSKCGPDTLVDDEVQTVDFEGQVLQVDDTNVSHMDIVDLHELRDSKQVYQFKAGPKGETAADNGKIIYTFSGRITNLTDAYPNKEVATTSGSISVSGNIATAPFVFTT